MGSMTVGCLPKAQRFGVGRYPMAVNVPVRPPDLQPKELLRTFPTGATRTTDLGKHDPEGYLSPLVIERYCEYMTTHRVQADGSLRASDNWQKGIPLEEYVKSLLRHTLDFWRAHRGWVPADLMEDAACAILFNISGWLHERVKARLRGAP